MDNTELYKLAEERDEIVKDLRSMTGGGMLMCRMALEESGWDWDKAFDIVRHKQEGRLILRRP